MGHHMMVRLGVVCAWFGKVTRSLSSSIVFCNYRFSSHNKDLFNDVSHTMFLLVTISIYPTTGIAVMIGRVRAATLVKDLSVSPTCYSNIVSAIVIL